VEAAELTNVNPTYARVTFSTWTSIDDISPRLCSVSENACDIADVQKAPENLTEKRADYENTEVDMSDTSTELDSDSESKSLYCVGQRVNLVACHRLDTDKKIFIRSGECGELTSILY